MKAFSSVDLYYFIKENAPYLEGSRIETFYQTESIFTTRLYIKQKGTLYLTTSLGEFISISSTKKEAPLHPSSFISYMRKHLKNSFIDSIEQVDFERILKINISNKKQDSEIYYYSLYVELFAGGNIILCDRKNTILNSLIKKTFKDRTVRNKQIYELPPKRQINPLEISRDEVKEIVEKSDLTIVKFLALECGFGGKYAEEFCKIQDVEKSTPVKKISVDVIHSLIKSPTLLELDPKIVIDNEKVIDFFPFNPTDKKCESKNSFNDCLREYYSQFEIVSKEKKDDAYLKKIKSLEKRIQKQEEQREKILEDSEIYSIKGEKIYENYELVDELLKNIKSAAKEKGWDYVFQVIENNPELKKYISKVDYKKNKLILKLD